MSPELLPLWRLLIESRKRPLSCAECFTVLEYLAETIPHNENGYDLKRLRAAADQHLATCPDCHDYYLQQLDEMELLDDEDVI